MAAKLPYFRWYPADAESDAKYSAMCLAERGLYHAALNYAWTNNGLPVEVAEVARVLRLTPREFLKHWPRVSVCFEIIDGKLRNGRQEEERADANEKGLKASLSAKRRWTGDANALRRHMPTHCEGNARAYGSDYDASFLKKRGVGKNNEIATESRFREWWEIWSAVRGTHHENEAAQAYISVAGGIEVDVLECTRSYLASLDNPAKGYNPHTFLFEQVGSGFRGRWPASISNARESATEKAIRVGFERVQKTGRL